MYDNSVCWTLVLSPLQLLEYQIYGNNNLHTKSWVIHIRHCDYRFYVALRFSKEPVVAPYFESQVFCVIQDCEAIL